VPHEASTYLHRLADQFDLASLAPSTALTSSLTVGGRHVTRIEAEFWTSRQRQASSLHEISYRACFKPQLPRFFIEHLTLPGDLVYDPFMGRGTTPLEAAMLGRAIAGNDLNPLSELLLRPRLEIPSLEQVRERLVKLILDGSARAEFDLSMFYHPATEGELVSLRQYLLMRKATGREDAVDRWIRMVATNRLTGHSAGFFSVYTLPPNQATTPENQRKINEKRKQRPPYRDVKSIIYKKSRSLLKKISSSDVERLQAALKSALLLSTRADRTPEIPDSSVQLVVTSPPFLNVVDYSQDNWLRLWFNGIDLKQVDGKLSVHASIEQWKRAMGLVFQELFRVVRPGGFVAFEVGEVRKRNVLLDEIVAPIGEEAGFLCAGILINRQQFTKTSNIWGINNNEGGTNTNRIVVFRKPR